MFLFFFSYLFFEISIADEAEPNCWCCCGNWFCCCLKLDELIDDEDEDNEDEAVNVLKPKLGIVCLVVMTSGGDDAFSIELFTFTGLTWLQLGHRSHCIWLCCCCCCCCVVDCCCWFSRLIEDDVNGCENKFVLAVLFVLLLAVLVDWVVIELLCCEFCNTKKKHLKVNKIVWK